MPKFQDFFFLYRMPPIKSQAHKRRAALANEGPSVRRSRRRLAVNSEQGDESSNSPSSIAHPEPTQSLVSTTTAEVSGERSATLPTLATPTVTADTLSTSQLSATAEESHHSDPPLSSETTATLAEEIIDESHSQTSGELQCCLY